MSNLYFIIFGEPEMDVRELNNQKLAHINNILYLCETFKMIHGDQEEIEKETIDKDTILKQYESLNKVFDNLMNIFKASVF